MSYQSIHGAGDSDSAGKLTALRIPDLAGKSVLDVGCNEGYFCNAALAAGAASVVGIDASKSAIALARQHYPRCEFIATDWDSFLAQNKDHFDVILFASALHYAKDQRALLSEARNESRSHCKCRISFDRPLQGDAKGRRRWVNRRRNPRQMRGDGHPIGA